MNKLAVAGASLDSKVPSEEDLRQPVKLLPLVDRDGNLAIPKALKWEYGRVRRNKRIRIVSYVGAAGDVPTESPEERIQEMTDPYRGSTRKDFTSCAYGDPTLGPALENRNNSFFEDSFDLVLELTNKIGKDGKPMDDSAQETLLTGLISFYAKPLQLIIDWSQKKDIMLLEKMKAAHISSVVQGRSLTLITPPLSILHDSMLPDA